LPSVESTASDASLLLVSRSSGLLLGHPQEMLGSLEPDPLRLGDGSNIRRCASFVARHTEQLKMIRIVGVGIRWSQPQRGLVMLMERNDREISTTWAISFLTIPYSSKNPHGDTKALAVVQTPMPLRYHAARPALRPSSSELTPIIFETKPSTLSLLSWNLRLDMDL
jgi:hypothetical protein